MKPQHNRTLVLNADYSALATVSWQKAITQVFKGSVHVVDFYKDDFVLCSNGDHYPIPAVVPLTEYKKPTNGEMPFSRKNVFLRDRLICQYCGKKFHHSELTYDHVIPRSKWNSNRRGTPTKWENIVSCCYACNSKKANRSPKECGMQPIKTPFIPSSRGFVLGLAPWSKLQPEWLPYIPKFYKELLSVDES